MLLQLCIVSNKDIDTVELTKICTHDPNIETKRACVHIFGTLALSTSLLLTCRLNTESPFETKVKINRIGNKNPILK